MSRQEAPKDFWPRLHELNSQLHTAAPVNKSRIPGVQASELDWMDRREEANIAESEFVPNVSWKGTQILGGLAYFRGTLKIIQPIEVTSDGEMKMGIGRLLAYRHAYDPLGDHVEVHTFDPSASHPKMTFREETEHINWIIKQGVNTPTQEEYDFLINAMAYGVAGHGHIERE